MAVSAAVSAGIYALSRSPVAAATSFAAGFLIDLDHVIDYWRAYPWRLSPRHFFVTCEEYRLKSLFLFLHSWELLFLLCLAAYFSRGAAAMGLMLGAAQHLILDQLCNHAFPGTYFFVYRWRAGFRGDAVFDIPLQFREAGDHGND
jgi:hypothetical protein